MTDVAVPSPVPAAGFAARHARLRRVIDALDGALLWVGCAMLFALMLVVVFDVAMRYFVNAPLSWSYQIISDYLMPGLFFFAVSDTLKANAHVAVDILHNYVGRRTRYVFETVVNALAAPVFFYCAWVSALKTYDDFASGAESTSGLALPTWSISLLLPLGFGLLALRLALNAAGYGATLALGREITDLPPISGTGELTE